MKDLIDRQAAIDALDELCGRECEYSKQQRSVMCGACHLGSAFDVVEQLPSVQPEVDCQKCIFRGFAGFKQFQTAQSDVSDTNVGDMISRQAAIDALIRKMRPHNNGDGTMTIFAMSEGLVRKTLNDLPSAQPETAKRTAESEQNVSDSDLISRKSAIDSFRFDDDGTPWSMDDIVYRLEQFPSAEEMPSADTVEVVRCKDCVYGEQDEIGRWYCRGFGCAVGDCDGNGYCADGERRA